MMYNNYVNRLKNIVAESHSKNNLIKGFEGLNEIRSTLYLNRKEKIQEQRMFTKQMHLSAQPLGNVLNGEQLINAKIGQHPDFIHLKGTDEVMYQYIVSVFIDIQGSTNLHKKYDLEDIYRITNTIQSAAIHTCIAMGGHIQRLQGDGVFAYFGGKNVEKNKAVELAVTACSMFTYFVKNDLKDVFLEDGIEDINTRIGIDFGDDNDVQWANFGLMEVSELTTNSLHTSLASKMQAYAPRNGIVVGQNVKNRLNIEDSIFDLVRNSKGEVEKRYIYEIPNKNFRYTQFNFDWFRYLKTLPTIRTSADGKLYIINAEEAERERKERLKATTSLLGTGNAFLGETGIISADRSGVHHQPHRFHYGQ